MNENQNLLMELIFLEEALSNRIPAAADSPRNDHLERRMERILASYFGQLKALMTEELIEEIYYTYVEQS